MYKHARTTHAHTRTRTRALSPSLSLTHTHTLSHDTYTHMDVPGARGASQIALSSIHLPPARHIVLICYFGR